MATTDQKTFIVDLPPELFERVGEMVQPEDLFNVRLTCKKAKADIMKLFAKTYFTRLTLQLYYKESLQRGAEIAAHPAFGCAIQAVDINVDELPTYEELEFFVGPGPKHGKDLQNVRDIAKLHKKMLATQEKMRADNACLQLLLLTLCHLKKHGRVREIAMCDENISGQAFFHPMRALARQGADPASHRDVLMPTPPSIQDDKYLGIILEALSLSGLEFPTFTMRWMREFPCVLPVHRLVHNERHLSNFQAVLTNLQSLKLSIWAKDDEPVPAKFTRTFNYATKLKDLHVEILNRHCNYPYHFILPLDTSSIVTSLLQQTLPSLEKLRFIGATITFSEFCAFAKRHSNLREVDATCCSLRGIEMHQAILWKQCDPPKHKATSKYRYRRSFGFCFPTRAKMWARETRQMLEECPRRTAVQASLDQKLTEMLGIKFGYLSLSDACQW